MKKCKVCKKVPSLERRVNCEGVVFCSDDCYEQFENSLNDFDHPYIDDYDAVRFEYMEWTKNFENRLYRSLSTYGKANKEELIEDIESVIEEFADYWRLEGSDGVFSQEIYHYLLELKKLETVIQDWEPEP